VTKKILLVALIFNLAILGNGLGQVSSEDLTGFSTLLVSPSPRHAAMGEGDGATTGDLFSLYANPAGMLDISYFSVGAAHNEWIADYRSEFVGLVYHPSKFACGFSLNYGTVGDIERRSGPTQEPEGHFDLNDLVLGISAAYQAAADLKLGLTTKLVYEKLDIYSSTGVAIDLGWQYVLRPQLTMGASLANLGSKLKLDREEYDLPQVARIGGSYLISGFLLGAELFYPLDDDPHLHVGGEYAVHEMFFLRSGFQSGYDEKALSFGMGFAHHGFSIDYAYVPFKSDLGDTHRLSIIYSLSKEE